MRHPRLEPAMIRTLSRATRSALLLASLLTSPLALAADLPAGYWTTEQRQAILDTTRTLRLDPDLADLHPGERAALAHLLAAGAIVQSIYERQVHPQAAPAKAALDRLPAGAARTETQDLFRLFKGPIATTLDNKREPFVPVAPVQPAKGFYPDGLKREELDAFIAAHPERRDELLDARSVVRRAERRQLDADLAMLRRHPALDLLHPGLRARLEALRKAPGGFYALPYSVAWADDTLALYDHLQQAAAAVQPDDAEFAGYLRARARDILSDDYEAGDAAWVTSDFRRLNAQIGAYETYDDELLGVRAAWSMSILVRRDAESDAVAGALGGLQALHDALPIQYERKVRERIPVGVFDVVADFGQARGGNTASILPNDPLHASRYGRTILMRDNIIRHPEARGVAAATWRAAIAADQQDDLQPEGSVQRTLWHEIGHYLGVDRTRDGRDVGDALQDSGDLFEEMKADLVSLGSVPRLRDSGYYTAAQAHAVYAAGILRVLQRNAPRRDQPYNTMQLMQWNWFLDRGVLAFDPATQRMRIDYSKYPGAVRALLAEVLEIQAAGDRDRAEAFIAKWTTWDPALHEPIARAIRDSLPYRYSLYRYAALGE
jgi:hypothetical protein